MLVKSNSTRLPGKNTLEFHGKPMYQVNLDKMLEIFDDVYVSTNDMDIFKQVCFTKAHPIMRPQHWTGEEPNIKVYQHALNYMKDCDGIVAVQANSPTIEKSIIMRVKEAMQDHSEVMTSHEDMAIYGSVWGVERHTLINYDDPYKPRPTVLIVDKSIDIHTPADYEQALSVKIEQ